MERPRAGRRHNGLLGNIAVRVALNKTPFDITRDQIETIGSRPMRELITACVETLQPAAISLPFEDRCARQDAFMPMSERPRIFGTHAPCDQHQDFSTYQINLETCD
jgi:hypothetical protein